MNELQKTQEQQIDNVIENIVLNGDLSKLNPQQKVLYYNAYCEKLGLNPLTKPFQLIKFQGKEMLYATKDATEQLRKINGISIFELEKLFQDGLYIVTAKAEDKTGRKDAATGALSITGLKGDALANAIMKAETKSKRRVTLSICGLGVLDESETDTIGDYSKVDITTGKTIETKETNSKPENKIPQKLDEELGSFILGIEDSNIKTEEELKEKCAGARSVLVSQHGEKYIKYINNKLSEVYKKELEKLIWGKNESQ